MFLIYTRDTHLCMQICMSGSRAHVACQHATALYRQIVRNTFTLVTCPVIRRQLASAINRSPFCYLLVIVITH